MVEMYWVKTYGMSTVSSDIIEKLHLDWVTMSGKVYWKTWALALLGSVFPVTEHVPQGYLEANFTGCKKKLFLLFIRLLYLRVATHIHMVLSLTNERFPWNRVSEGALNDFKDFYANKTHRYLEKLSEPGARLWLTVFSGREYESETTGGDYVVWVLQSSTH